MSAADRTGDDTRTLVRRYEMLLHAYPGRWRAERGDEMIGTLLDAAAPGQRRPSVRESASIVTQGLKERLDLRRRRTTRAVWTEGLCIGALVLLGQAFASVALRVVEDSRDFQDAQFLHDVGASPYLVAHYAAPLLLGITAMAALVTGRTVVAAVAAGLWAAAPAMFGQLPWQIVTAFVILAGLSVADRTPRRRTSAVWLAVVPAVAVLWLGHHLLAGTYISPADVLLYPFVLLTAVTAGVLIDPRLPIAAACPTIVILLDATLHVPSLVHGATIGGVPQVHLRPQTVILGVIAVGLLTIGHLRARRLARI
ncbi:hypothetical protein [Dactylosporangium sp. NPDC005555]|uniref:hypothetical protein n=1 Tax=Dactylosporangium sp. NPDC005555 TaxID=3154889 RepID=UPI0033B8A1FA